MEKKCHDCNCEEGEIHEYGCDMERCPFCGNQLIGCHCLYEFLGYKIDSNHPTSGLPKEIYESGLSDEELSTWMDILKARGRIPYIQYPNICCYCGKLWPDLFSVPDKEWKKYIQIGKQNTVICRECYDYIKNTIDSNCRNVIL